MSESITPDPRLAEGRGEKGVEKGRMREGEKIEGEWRGGRREREGEEKEGQEYSDSLRSITFAGPLVVRLVHAVLTHYGSLPNMTLYL